MHLHRYAPVRTDPGHATPRHLMTGEGRRRAAGQGSRGAGVAAPLGLRYWISQAIELLMPLGVPKFISSTLVGETM